MNRLERLVAILLLLQEKPQTAEQIARRFEISRRTVLRDVQSLSEMGVPVIAQQGPGGGYALMEDYRIEPLPLTSSEAFLLLLALYGIQQLSDLPFRRELQSLLAKVRAVLPVGEEERALGLLGNTRTDEPGKSKQRAPFLEALIQATEEKQWTRITYRSRAQANSVQHILPRRVFPLDGFWYFHGYSAEHGEERTYRADRVLGLERPAEDFVAPLPTASIPYDDPSNPQIVARLTRRGAARVEANRYLRDHVHDASDQGSELIFRCPPGELDWWAHYFASLGTDAQIIEPPVLRERLRDLGQELVSRYQE